MSSEISFSHELARILTNGGFIADYWFSRVFGPEGGRIGFGGDGEWLLVKWAWGQGLSMSGVGLKRTTIYSFGLIRLGIWSSLGGEVEDCWLEIAARAGSRD